MSYTAHPYLVDVPHLQRLYGSHDAEMVQHIEHAHEGWFAHEEVPHPVMRFNLNTGAIAHGLSEPPPLRLRQALYELFAGRVSRPDQAQQYVYALMLVCAHIGTELPYEEFDGLRSTGIYIVGQFEGLEALTGLSRAPLPIPALPVPQEEFPTVTYVPPEEAGHLVQQRQVRRSAVRFPRDRPPSPHDKAWVEAAQRQYDAWLRACTEAERTLIVFLH